jgi:phosphatidylglycerophosphatase C
VTRTVAAFDFDGTLTRRDTLLPFLARVAGWQRVGPALAASVRGGRDASKERLLARTLGGRAHSEIADAGAAYGHAIVRTVTPEMRRRVAWHRDEGHELVIVSASLDVYVDAAARELGIAHALSTSLHVDDEGRVTGRMLGGNCRGDEKVARLRTHIGDDDVVLWAYGNSSGDEAMLALADHAVRVRRGRPRS